MSTSYQKPTTSIQEQVELLRSRGLSIKNQQEAEHYLTYIGYYRLAGYWQVFQDDKIKHTFLPGVTFRHIKELYNFDRELRILLCDAIERIEIGLRALMTNIMCNSYGPNWFSDEKYAERTDRFNDNLVSIDSELARSMEDFVLHHDQKYGKTPPPPAWKTLQVLSFGSLSKLYSNIKNSLVEKKTIAQAVGLPNELWLESWILVISVLRNYCAHHSRVCYRTFNFPPKDLRKAKLPWITNLPSASGKLREHLYYQLCAVRYILHSVSPDNHFSIKLKELIKKYPSVSLPKMGFPPEWEEEELWK
jgi:abortive infection bacteriophage resistance protein